MQDDVVAHMRRVVDAGDPEARGRGSLPDHIVAHRHPRSVRGDADRLAGALWRQVADPIALDIDPDVEDGVGRRVDPVGRKIHQAVSPGDAVDDIVDNVALRVDGVDLAAYGRAPVLVTLLRRTTLPAPVVSI